FGAGRSGLAFNAASNRNSIASVLVANIRLNRYLSIRANRSRRAERKCRSEKQRTGTIVVKSIHFSGGCPSTFQPVTGCFARASHLPILPAAGEHGRLPERPIKNISGDPPVL